MKPYFPTKELEEENERLVEQYLATDEDIDVDDFIEQHASPAFKKYLKDKKKEEDELFKKGIII